MRSKFKGHLFCLYALTATGNEMLSEICLKYRPRMIQRVYCYSLRLSQIFLKFHVYKTDVITMPIYRKNNYSDTEM